MTPADGALDWIGRGFLPVPIPFRSKRAVIEGWPSLRIGRADVAQYFDGAPQNVGVLLGAPYGSADIDADCPEAVTAAAILAPETGLIFGRQSKPGSHRFYRCDPPLRSKKYTDPTDKKCLVELRCLASDGEVGLQTVVPPSVHECGETIRFEPGFDHEPANVDADVLAVAVGRIAAAALLAKHWPQRGTRHDAMLALAGVLCRAGWPQAEGQLFCRALYRAVGTHDPAAIGRSDHECADTYEKHRLGSEVTGLPTLAEAVGQDVASAAVKWLRTKPEDTSAHRTAAGPVPAFAEAGEVGSSEPQTSKDAGRQSQATKLLKLVQEGFQYFRTPEGEPYATVWVDDHFETHHVRSRPFRVILQQRYYDEKRTALGAKSLADALGVIESKALFRGNEHRVSCRVAAGDNGRLYLDLGGPKWDAVEIDQDDWRIVPNPPAKFYRSRGMLPIAPPRRDPQALKHLRKLYNVKPDSNDLELILAFQVAALRPGRPCPPLVINSEAGSAKTTTCRAIRTPLDPNEAPVRAQPKDERDLMIAAANAYVLAFDNLSHLPEWLSDSFCRLSTGGGFATRELFSDRDEVLINVQRPVLLNGIEELVTRGDLADRSIVIELPAIPEDRRITEKEYWGRFNQCAPGILAFLLDAAACALRNVGSVRLSRTPRMADFAEWVTAAEPALGWEPGFFVGIYQQNRTDANNVTIEASPVARHLLTLGGWTGTASELLRRLNAMASEQDRKLKSWPGSAKGLSNALRRLLPNLRAAGVAVAFDRASGGNRDRIISIAGVGDGPPVAGRSRDASGTERDEAGTQESLLIVN